MSSNHDASTEASQPADDLAQRKVRVSIADAATGVQRDCSVLFTELPGLIASLSASERLTPSFSDDELAPDAGGVLILEAQAVPKHTETLLELFEWANRTLPALWFDTAVVGVPFYENGVLQSGRFVVALDENDPAQAAVIGDRLADRSALAGAFIWRDGDTRSIGGRVRVVGDVASAEGAEHLSGSSFLSIDEDDLLPVSPQERCLMDEVRAARWPEIASDYERAASLLGSAEPIFFAATAELSGQAVWDMLATLQRAALHPDPLAEFVRTKVIPLARQYRDDAADRARFEMLISARLRQHSPEYNALPASEAALVRLAAWLFAAPASLFVGRGVGASRPLIRPGDGTQSAQPWLVEGWLPAIGLCALVGGSGEGKSQIAVDLAARVATMPADGTARRFAGRAIAGAPSVLYFGSEGISGWNARAKRQIPHVSGRQLSEPHGLRIADGVPPLSSPIAALTCVREKVEEILRDGGEAPSIIIIDHLRAAMAGNEDNSGDMDLACGTMYAIARMAGCCVGIVAHAKKNTDGGNIVARGSSALRANLDFEATVKKDGNSHRLTVTKNRNGAEGDSFTWHIPGLNAPVHEGESLRQASLDDSKMSEQAAEVAGRVIRDCATSTRGVTTRELNDAMLAARPSLFLKPDGKRDGSRLLRARADAVKRSYIAEGKRGMWIVGDKAPPEATALFDMSKTPDALDDLAA